MRAPGRVPSEPRGIGKKDIWQIGMIRMPAWVKADDGSVYRPWGALAASLTAGLMMPSTLERSSERSGVMAIEAFDRLLAQAGVPPGLVEVNDPHLAAALTEPLAARGIAVAACDLIESIVLELYAARRG